MKNQLLLLIALLTYVNTASPLVGQEPAESRFQTNEMEKYTLSGIIRDASNGDNLIGAAIYIPELKTGAVCNNYGFYSITLPAGTYIIQFSFVGYTPVEKEVALTANLKLNIDLSPGITSVGEVVVKGTTAVQNLRSTTPGMTRLSPNEMKGIPTFGGMPDVMKSLQLLPGIMPVNEGLTQYSVRGGSYDQNLILLDEAPVYNPSHVLGFFSVFNTDAIQSVEMMKGFIPARFGGRLSSVADIRMREGNHNRFRASGNISPVAAGLTLESPMLNKKASVLISGRYFNLIPVNYLIEGINGVMFVPGLINFPTENKINFYDVNFKVNYKANDKNQVYFSGYSGSDGFYFPIIDARSRQEWGNTTATLRWNHVAGDKLFFNASAIYSHYNYAFNINDGAENYRWSAYLNQVNAKIDWDYYPNVNNHIEFGASTGFHGVMPGKITPTDTGSMISGYEMNIRRSMEAALYLSNEHKLGRFAFNYGIRVVPYFSFSNPAVDTAYATGTLNDQIIMLEPRLSLRYILSPQISVKLAYCRNSQPIHLLSNSSAGLPTDIWLPADKVLRPQVADHLSGGIFFNLLNEKLEASVEGYYKKLRHIIDYKDNAVIRLNEDVEYELLSGTGRSFGAEFFLRKSTGKLTGWAGYTLSKTERWIEGINHNRYYPARYDQRHSLSLFLSQEMGRRWVFSATFNYRTGQAVTMPIGSFMIKSDLYTYYSDRNGFRLPTNHRLDMSLKLKSREKEGRKSRSEWSASVFNVYDRHNVFSFFFSESDNDRGKIGYRIVYLPGILPILSYSLYF